MSHSKFEASFDSEYVELLYLNLRSLRFVLTLWWLATCETSLALSLLFSFDGFDIMLEALGMLEDAFDNVSMFEGVEFFLACEAINSLNYELLR